MVRRRRRSRSRSRSRSRGRGQGRGRAVGRKRVPKMAVLIRDALVSLKSKRGASTGAIGRRIKRKYGPNLPKRFRKSLGTQLRVLARDGRLNKLRGRFCITPQFRKNPNRKGKGRGRKGRGRRRRSTSRRRRSRSRGRRKGGRRRRRSRSRRRRRTRTRRAH